MKTETLRRATLTTTFVVIRDEEEVQLTVGLWLDRDGEVLLVGASDRTGLPFDLARDEKKEATELLLDLVAQRHQDALADAFLSRRTEKRGTP